MQALARMPMPVNISTLSSVQSRVCAGARLALPLRAYRSSVGRAPAPAPAAIQNFFSKEKKASAPKKAKRETVIPEPSYNIPLTLLGLAGISGYEGATPAAVLFGILGVFLTVQASRVKFVFDDDALEVVVGKQKDSTENVFVGGANRWKYDTFVNWELWWPGFPVLVYFKETQTRPEGQIHFFPLIFNGKQVYEVMVERCGKSQTSGPK